MRIAVVDDEKYSRSELIHQIKAELPEAEVFEAASGTQMLKTLDERSFDILFVDVHLGDMEGTTVASLARKLCPKAKIVFATAYSEYAVTAFELQADDYVLKPFDPERIRQALCRCMPDKGEKRAKSTKLAINVDRRTVLIDIDSILYIETDGLGHNCIIHTKNENFADSATLTQYEHRLAAHGFYRIHKSCLVQLCYIQDIFAWTNSSYALRMRGCPDVLPIGRERLKKLRNILEI